MHRKYNKFLIVSVIVISIFGVYSYFSNDLKSEAAIGAADTTDADTGSGLTSSLDTNATSTSTNNAGGEAAENTAFVIKLNSLKNIRIDTSLFTDKSFTSLVDNNVVIEEVPYGRINPFAPLNNFNTVIKTADIVTVEPGSVVKAN